MVQLLAKLLFTEGTKTEVPYLDLAETWQGHVLEDINNSTTSKRKNQGSSFTAN